MAQAERENITDGLTPRAEKEGDMIDSFDSSRFSDSGPMYDMHLASSPLRNHPSMSQSRDDTDFYLEK